MKYTIQYYKAADGWRCRVVARNGNTILNVGQGYARKSTMVRSVNNFLTFIENTHLSWDELWKEET